MIQVNRDCPERFLAEATYREIQGSSREVTPKSEVEFLDFIAVLAPLLA